MNTNIAELLAASVRTSHDDATEFQPRRPEVHQQTETQARGSQVVHALGTVNYVKHPDSFQFDQD